MGELTGRDFLKEVDFTPEEWMHLIDLSGELKAARREGREERRLSGKSIALIFEKGSTRTRAAFEVAAWHQGAFTTYLDPSGSHIGSKESPADTARVLERMYDGIEFRGARQDTVETLAEYSSVPVWNGLTDDWHPTQSLCDAFTMLEASPKPAGEIAFSYLGDCRFNMGNSLLTMGAMMGMDVRLVSPRSFAPSADLVDAAREIAEFTGARITITGQGPCPGEVRDWAAEVSASRIDVNATHGTQSRCRCSGTGDLVLRGLDPGTYDVHVNGGFDRPIATRVVVLQ